MGLVTERMGRQEGGDFQTLSSGTEDVTGTFGGHTEEEVCSKGRSVQLLKCRAAERGILGRPEGPQCSLPPPTPGHVET